jgi:hypothetical protein
LAYDLNYVHVFRQLLVTLVVKFPVLAKGSLIETAGAAKLLPDVSTKQLRGAQPDGLMLALDLPSHIILTRCHEVLHTTTTTFVELLAAALSLVEGTEVILKRLTLSFRRPCLKKL